jgi:hypothetical protein
VISVFVQLYKCALKLTPMNQAVGATRLRRGCPYGASNRLLYNARQYINLPITEGMPPVLLDSAQVGLK